MEGRNQNARINYGLPLFIFLVSIILIAFPVNVKVYADETVWYSQTTNNAGSAIGGRSDQSKFIGEEFVVGSSFIGYEFDRIKINLQCGADGTACDALTGSAIIGVWDSTVEPTSANVITEIGTVVANTLPEGSSTEYTFNFAGHEVAANQMVGVYYDAVHANSNYFVMVRYSTSDLVGSTTTRWTNYHVTTGFADQTTRDIMMKLINSGTGVGSDECPALSICFDVDGDGLIDTVWDDPNGDNIVDFDWNDLPVSAADPRDSIPGFFQVFGFGSDAADLIATTIIHAIVVFGIPGAFFVMTKVNPPFFVWVFAMVLGGGLSAAIGFMPLLFFFVEVALIVGAVAALIKTGVIGL